MRRSVDLDDGSIPTIECPPDGERCALHERKCCHLSPVQCAACRQTRSPSRRNRSTSFNPLQRAEWLQTAGSETEARQDSVSIRCNARSGCKRLRAPRKGCCEFQSAAMRGVAADNDPRASHSLASVSIRCNARSGCRHSPDYTGQAWGKFQSAAMRGVAADAADHLRRLVRGFNPLQCAEWLQTHGFASCLSSRRFNPLHCAEWLQTIGFGAWYHTNAVSIRCTARSGCRLMSVAALAVILAFQSAALRGVAADDMPSRGVREKCFNPLHCAEWLQTYARIGSSGYSVSIRCTARSGCRRPMVPVLVTRSRFQSAALRGVAADFTSGVNLTRVQSFNPLHCAEWLQTPRAPSPHAPVSVSIRCTARSGCRLT